MCPIIPIAQAASAAEATSWIDAIAITAQHVGVAQHDPQCIILPTEDDALRVSEVIQDARRRLLAAMTAAARARHGELTLDIVTSFRPGPTAHDLRVAESDALYAASLATADHEDDTGHGVDAGGAGDRSRDVAPPAAEGILLDDAVAMARAMGGVSQELMAQMAPDVAWAVMQALQQQSQQQHEEGAVSSPHGVDDGYWVFIDDTDRPQGPFPANQMREWLRRGRINESSLVRSCTPVPGFSLEQGVDDVGIPIYFLPLGVLFPAPLTPESAFRGAASWAAAYEHAALFESLVASATQLGVDHGLAVHHALFLKDGGMAPDLSLLLDLCGWTGVPPQGRGGDDGLVVLEGSHHVSPPANTSAAPSLPLAEGGHPDSEAAGTLS